MGSKLLISCSYTICMTGVLFKPPEACSALVLIWKPTLNRFCHDCQMRNLKATEFQPLKIYLLKHSENPPFKGMQFISKSSCIYIERDLEIYRAPLNQYISLYIKYIGLYIHWSLQIAIELIGFPDSHSHLQCNKGLTSSRHLRKTAPHWDSNLCLCYLVQRLCTKILLHRLTIFPMLQPDSLYSPLCTLPSCLNL